MGVKEIIVLLIAVGIGFFIAKKFPNVLSKGKSAVTG